jgi:CubicO group peptidase (beta-lactamase class C family)
VTQVVYESSGADSRELVAVARRKGEITYVVLLDGTAASLDRRGAQLSTAVGSLRAPGIEEESFAGKKANVLDKARLEAFAAFVEESRAKGKVPGVAIAVVQGNKIVLERGLGSRALGQPEAVTPNTLFMIGSITKPLTSLMMAKLVDEGRLSWDTPVTELMPTFALGDAAATKKLTLRHTLCACTGLPRQDMMLFFGYGRETPESRLEEMKRLSPTTPFGETFQYSNLMVTAGGYVAAHVAEPKKPLGPAYDAVMKSRVLEPIGMNASTFDFAVAQKRDHAQPHATTATLDVRVLPESAEAWIPNIRPCGGLWSSAHDMARWVAVELGEGKTLEGKAVVSAASLRERYKPMVRASEKQSYGLALMVEKYGGVDVAWHNGGTLGFNTEAIWLPEHQVGLVVLTNMNGAGAFLNGVRRRFFEVLFDAKDEAAKGFESALERKKKTFEAEFGKLDRAPEWAFLEKIAGAWENPALGKITIKGTTLEAADWKSKLARRTEADGTDKIVLIDPPWVGFDFVAKPDGTLVLDLGQEKYVFKR